MSTSTQKTGGGGGRVPKRDGGRVRRSLARREAPVAPCAQGRRAGSAARPERHDGGRGSEPIFFWRGSCNDAIPRPRGPPAARPSPGLFFAFLLRRVDVSRPVRLYSFLYFSLTDSCLPLVCVPTRDKPSPRRGPPSPWGLELTCEGYTFGSAGSRLALTPPCPTPTPAEIQAVPPPPGRHPGKGGSGVTVDPRALPHCAGFLLLSLAGRQGREHRVWLR